MGRGKSEDWREAHITGEKSKVYDPLLFGNHPTNILITVMEFKVKF